MLAVRSPQLLTTFTSWLASLTGGVPTVDWHVCGLDEMNNTLKGVSVPMRNWQTCMVAESGLSRSVYVAGREGVRYAE